MKRGRTVFNAETNQYVSLSTVARQKKQRRFKSINEQLFSTLIAEKEAQAIQANAELSKNSDASTIQKDNDHTPITLETQQAMQEGYNQFSNFEYTYTSADSNCETNEPELTGLHEKISPESNLTNHLLLLILGETMINRNWTLADIQVVLDLLHTAFKLNKSTVHSSYQFKKVSLQYLL